MTLKWWTYKNLRSFSTPKGAYNALDSIEENISDILNIDPHTTARYTHDTPEAWRVLWQLWDLRVQIHKIFPGVEGVWFFHPHPWPSIVKILDGGYTHSSWSYNGPEQDMKSINSENVEDFWKHLVRHNTQLVPWSSYTMTDVRQYHEVLPTKGPSYSLMITGTPYFKWATKAFSRNIITSPPPELTAEQISELTNVAQNFYNI